MPLPKTTENISISIPSWLLEEVDIYCDHNDFTRSKFVSRAIRKYLLLKTDSMDLWEQIYNEKRGL